MLQSTAASILCALCGIKFIPSSGSLCPTCTIKQIEVVKVLRGDTVTFCSYCQRYQRPPWVHCDRQSQQMMSLLLKKTKGLSKVEFQSATFVWTQPHCRRIKLKIIFNRQINDKMKLQCIQVVQFIQKYSQCVDCKKKFTPHDWTAVVQIRQYASHKKTISSLEQNLLKQKISQKILKTETAENGLDVFYNNEHDGQRLVDYLKSRYPAITKLSKQLVSHNEQNNTSTVKITYSVVIPKICKDDLVRIPKKLTKQLGSCSEALYCIKVSSNMYFLDITNFRKVQINSTQYSKYEGLMEIFPLKVHGRTFNILDSEEKQQANSNYSSIFGLVVSNQEEYKEIYTRCHFNDEPGRDVLGFDFAQIENLDDIKNMPDIFIGQKIKDKQQKKKNRQRKRMKIAVQKSEIASQMQSEKGQQEEEQEQDQDLQDQWEDDSSEENINEVS